MRFISSVICASDFVLSSARSHTTKILLVCKCVDVKPLGASLLSFSLSLCLSLFSSLFFLIWITTIFLICFTKYITNCRRLVQLSGSRWTRRSLLPERRSRWMEKPRAFSAKRESYHRKNITLRDYILIVTSLSEDAATRRIVGTLPSRLLVSRKSFVLVPNVRLV